MEKWNFDVIFTGTNEEQEIKAARFRTGVSEKVKKACALYADAVLYPEDKDQAHRRLLEVRDLEQAYEALVNDPRGKALREWVEKRSAEKEAEELAAILIGVTRGRKQ